MISSCSEGENSEHLWWSQLVLSFPDNITFLEALHFLIVFHFSDHYERSDFLTTYYPKPYIEFLSMSLMVAH